MSEQLQAFYNDGFGWICKRCERELKGSEESGKRSRLLSEGEAESKNPKLSSVALARWLDPARTILVCPHCGVTESVSLS